MTLRQIYYRLVAVHNFENKMSNYQYLGKSLTWARRNKQIPYSYIEDRTRRFHGGDIKEKPDSQELFDSLLDNIERWEERLVYPRWHNQTDYLEIWIEKQALEGVFLRAIGEKAVTLAVCRGYPSLTYQRRAFERIAELCFKEEGENATQVRDATILYFGDHDPSGIDIERSVKAQMEQFGLSERFLTVKRIGITEDQIAKYDIPSVPAKKSDPRTKEGDIAVELDALDPQTLEKLTHEAIAEYFDEGIYRDVLMTQSEEQTQLRVRIDKRVTVKKEEDT